MKAVETMQTYEAPDFDVTLTLDHNDALELLEILLDRPQREQWSSRVLAELRSALK